MPPAAPTLPLGTPHLALAARAPYGSSPEALGASAAMFTNIAVNRGALLGYGPTRGLYPQSLSDSYGDQFLHSSGAPLTPWNYNVPGVWSPTTSQMIAAVHHYRGRALRAEGKLENTEGLLAMRTAEVMALRGQLETGAPTQTSAETYTDPTPLVAKSFLDVTLEAVQERRTGKPAPTATVLIDESSSEIAGPVLVRQATPVAKAAAPTFSQAQVRYALAVPTSFAETPAKVETLQQKASLSTVEQLQLEQAEQQMAVVKSLQTNPETMSNGLALLTTQVADRVEGNQGLSTDSRALAYQATKPQTDALAKVQRLLSTDSADNVDVAELRKALAPLGLEAAFEQRFFNQASVTTAPTNLPKQDVQEFLVATLFDRPNRDTFFALVDARIATIGARQTVVPTDLTQDPILRGRLENDILRDARAPDIDYDSKRIDEKGPSNGASDHGPGTGPQ